MDNAQITIDNGQLTMGNSQLVPPGYKQTEVGVIPDDWDSSKIGDYAFVTKLAGFEYTLYFDYSKSGSIIAVRALNIKNGALYLDEVHTIPKETSDGLPRSKLRKGDLVMSYVGTLGRVAVIPEDERYHLAPNVAKLSVNRQTISPEYLSQYLNSSQGQRSVIEAAASTTQAALSMHNLREMSFVRPPLVEQEAIAAALSDADALIEALEQLIAKKRQVKQGAMQELLTGKRRLPGFSGEWRFWQLGDIANILKGNGLSKAQTSTSGSRPCILYGELFTTYGRVITEVLNHTNSDRGLPSVSGDVLMPGSTTTTGIDLAIASALLQGNVALGGDINVIRRKGHDYDSVFLANCLTYIKNHEIAEITQGITIHHLYGRNLKMLSVYLPSLPEQTAIAAILSDMDAEIAALEEKLTKARQVKQGMMQELLTGRTRLIENG